MRRQLEKTITFQGCRLCWSFNFEWYGQNEVGNIVIHVFWRNREKLYCITDSNRKKCIRKGVRTWKAAPNIVFNNPFENDSTKVKNAFV